MAEFKRRCLYRATNFMGEDGPEMFESTWAYSVQYPGADHRTPGRYRIRITKMTGAEFMAMMGQEVDADEIVVDYSMQAFLEKWGSDGWIHTIDWIGNPESSTSEIESDLNEMFQSFTTGEPVGSDFHGSMGPPGPPKPKRPKPKKNAAVPDVPAPDVSTSDTSKPDSGFDWI